MTARPDADGAPSQRPRERAPKNATFSFEVLRRPQPSPLPTALDLPNVRFVKRARVAIGAALDAAGARPGDRVLVPSYHCPSMVDPLLDRSLRPVFYAVRPDASIDIVDLERRLRERPRAVIATHYFGFPQHLAELRALCDRQGVILIEDCAHAFFGAFPGAAVATVGDFSAVSLWKFFPVPDGGAVVSARHGLGSLKIPRSGLSANLRLCFDTLQYAAEHGRLGVAALPVRAALWAKDTLWRWLRPRSPHDAGRPAQPVPPSPLRVPMVGMAGVAVWLVRRSSSDRIVARRRANYLRMASAWADLPGCHLLHPELPPGVVPQVVPLYVDEAERIFDRLASRGVPMIRFGRELAPEMDGSEFPVTLDLSGHVLQFVCHQDLTDREVDFITKEVSAALLGIGDAPAGTRRPGSAGDASTPEKPAPAAWPAPGAGIR